MAMQWVERTTTRIVIVMVGMIFGSLQAKILAFHPMKLPPPIPRVVTSARNRRTLLRNGNAIREASPVPTLLNPISKRRIHLGGPKYKQLVREGGWVQHRGTLERLDLEMLSHYQQDPSFRDEKAIPTTFPIDSNVDDAWYSITPSVVQGTQLFASAKSKGSTPQQIPIEKKTAEKIRQELLFVNKPSGLLSVPSRSLSDCLANQVLSSYPGSKPCHRLDRDTSGIVLFGLTHDAHRDISMQFAARTTSKTYVALIAGRPEKDQGVVNLPIGKQRTEEGFNRWTIGGYKPRESVTEWTVDKVFNDEETGASFTRVKLKPITGRGHQLRLHMKAIGCPILGDTIHGEGGVALCSSRLCLHAQTLEVDWDGLRLRAESVPPF
mmetsp:Transcript_406/g.1033  ORF Transcript_406/g.1033 Transcript_406/m.1033 type:complete len:380 (+) Transcript_406:301-1440(+)